MHRLGRNKWTAIVALGAMFTAQLAAPRYGVAQDSNNDSAFRLNENVGQNGNGAGSHPAPGARLADPLDRSGSTATPIKHVILIIGENRTFDHVFATYQPPRGQTVNNLLSEKIVTVSGALGTNAAAAAQWQASDTTTFSNDPTKTTLFSSYLPSTPMGRLLLPSFPVPQRPRRLNRRCRAVTMASWLTAELAFQPMSSIHAFLSL